jgi:RNA polymerase sigma factor (sigma-70 family)
MYTSLLGPPRVSDDTSIGGRRAFPNTTWGLVVRVARPHGDRRAGLETLSQRYWKPIYTFLRHALKRDNEEAKDLTQGFFLWLIDSGETLHKFDRDEGAFRHFLKALLRNFVRNEDTAGRALKRGGGRSVLSLEGAELLIADPSATTPEEAFDHAWVDALLDQAHEQVRVHYQEKGQAIRFEVFESYQLAPPGARPTYADVARQHGLAEHDVRNWLFSVREKIRSELRSALRDTVATHEQLEAEWSDLFGA